MELDYIEIGRNIRHYRLMRNIKQKELAEMIQVSDQHISHIENGYTKLSLITLVSIANALKVDCNTLLGDTIQGARESALQKKLMSIIGELDIKKLGLAVEFCDMLAKYDLEP